MANLTNDKEERESMNENSEYFETLATDLLAHCASTDLELTHELLLRKIVILNGRTCLKMAYDSQSRKFMSHISCQRLIQYVWNGYLLPGHKLLRILITVIMPPFLFLLNFRRSSEIKRLQFSAMEVLIKLLFF